MNNILYSYDKHLANKLQNQRHGKTQIQKKYDMNFDYVIDNEDDNELWTPSEMTRNSQIGMNTGDRISSDLDGEFAFDTE